MPMTGIQRVQAALAGRPTVFLWSLRSSSMH